VPEKALRPRWPEGYQARLRRPGNAVLSKIAHPLNIIDFTMGNRQIKGLDFIETFAPVSKFTTIRCILAKTAAKGWELHPMDFKTAFLNGDLDEEVYMEQPDGYVHPTYPEKVCRLL